MWRLIPAMPHAAGVRRPKCGRLQVRSIVWFGHRSPLVIATVPRLCRARWLLATVVERLRTKTNEKCLCLCHMTPVWEEIDVVANERWLTGILHIKPETCLEGVLPALLRARSDGKQHEGSHQQRHDRSSHGMAFQQLNLITRTNLLAVRSQVNRPGLSPQ